MSKKLFIAEDIKKLSKNYQKISMLQLLVLKQLPILINLSEL